MTAATEAGAGGQSRDEQLERLLGACDSELERSCRSGPALATPGPGYDPRTMLEQRSRCGSMFSDGLDVRAMSARNSRQ